MSLFESSITGNILNDGATTEISGITAGQLATVLQAYTPLTDTAANTASISANTTGVANNAAAIAALQTQVGGLPASPDLSPYALATDLAAAEGLIAANASGITALNTRLTTGLAGKVNQSALDALQLEVDGKSTPASVDTKLQAYSTTAAMNSAIASANNATLASVASTYALRTVTDQLALDLAAKQSSLDVDTKIANALLDKPSTTDLNTTVALRTTPADVDQKVTTALLTYVTQVALDAALALRDGRLDAAEGSIAALQAAGYQTAAQVASAIATALLPYTDTTGLNSLLAVHDGRLDSAETSLAALQAAGHQTSAQVAGAIASALLPYVQQTGLDAALAIRDARLDGHDADILTLQSAGPFATSADLTAAETSLQSAIDAILAQLAVLNSGGGSNLANAQPWPGEITWDLLLGTNTLRNLHFNAPLSVSLQNDNFTLSLACDAYSIAQADAAIAAALVPYETAAQRDAAIAAALAPYETAAQRDAAIAAALAPYWTQAQTQAAIDAAVGAVDLSGYYTSAQTDAAITSALVPVTLSNAPAWTGTWELLKGSNVIRNLHFAGPLSASLQNNADTLEIDCDSYEKAETFTQAEVNSVVSGAVDALNIAQYRTESQVNQAITDALVPYATDADISATTAGLLTHAQGDARYFATSASLGGVSIVRSNVTPPQIRAMTVASGTPLSISAILSGTIIELGCNAYTRQEADTRYVRTGTYTTTLDPRYLVQNATPGNAEVFTIIRDANAAPRQLRGILPRAPLSWQNILSGTVTELLCDAYSKSESDGKYALATDVSSIDTRVTALEASGGGVPDPLTIGEVRGDGASLILRAGSSTVNVVAQDSTPLATFSTPPRMRVDTEIYIDDATGTAAGLQTNAVSARAGDPLLTLTGGSAGARSAGALEITGITTGTEAVFPTSVATGQLQPSPSTNAHMRIFTGATGLEVSDQSLNPLLQVEDDETKSLSRVLSVTRSASTAAVGLVVKNTASIGTARVQLDSNNATGLAKLEVSSASGCILEAPGQEIGLQNRVSGQAPLIVEISGVITTAYGQNDLSDAKIKENIRDVDVEEMQSIFDRAMPKRYDRIDTDLKGQLGFLAQDFEGTGVTGKVEALESRGKKPKSRAA